MDLELADMFGKPPAHRHERPHAEDPIKGFGYEDPAYERENCSSTWRGLIQLEAVACKDWLTNKVDRSVTGKIAKQQCAGHACSCP
jgi:phosphoribosylformylglycinamidine synthase